TPHSVLYPFSLHDALPIWGNVLYNSAFALYDSALGLFRAGQGGLFAIFGHCGDQGEGQRLTKGKTQGTFTVLIGLNFLHERLASRGYWIHTYVALKASKVNGISSVDLVHRNAIADGFFCVWKHFQYGRADTVERPPYFARKALKISVN